ncbi:MAG TPA: JAB domain-containing protein [Pedobacter sp.]|uniref:JAB domain-containing protein n=1 Tax=Pedobacter sp. TaxID=1411316 RepID=UPI002BC3E532|nr:JAB domain-containing protein [Pedobacter sp.]HMI01139.1 JAB domain-containing protein [Pedobacter sp.]
MKAKSQVSLFQVSEIQVSYYPKFKASERPKISTSQDAYNILYNNWNLGKLQMQEQFYILLLNRANNVIGISEVSTGGVAGTICDPKIIFGTALKANASSIILAHNHPSGNLKPSTQDIQITRKMAEGGRLLDLFVHDHLIISSNGYYSFGDEGLI